MSQENPLSVANDYEDQLDETTSRQRPQLHAMDEEEKPDPPPPGG